MTFHFFQNTRKVYLPSVCTCASLINRTNLDPFHNNIIRLRVNVQVNHLPTAQQNIQNTRAKFTPDLVTSHANILLTLLLSPFQTVTPSFSTLTISHFVLTLFLESQLHYLFDSFSKQNNNIFLNNFRKQITQKLI